MSIYVLPALLALIIKIVVLFYAYRSQGQSKMFVLMVSVFACHNISEVLVFLEAAGTIHSPYVISIYYVSSIWALFTVLSYVLEVCRIEILKLKIGVAALASVLTILIVFSHFIIDGERSIGYVVTAVRGPLYWTFQAFSLGIFVSSVALLIKSTNKSKNHLIEIQSSYTLLALSPLVIGALSIMTLMNLGVSVNAAAIMPIATTLFLLITFKSETQHKLTDLRRFLPWSQERRTSSDIMEIFSSYAKDDMSYRDAVSDIERLLVMHKYDKSGGNASQTAQQMGMPRSSLYSIFNRLSIKTND